MEWNCSKRVVHWNKWSKSRYFYNTRVLVQKKYIFLDVAFHTLNVYVIKKRTKKPFISLNDFFWWLSRNKRPKEPFCLSFLFFKYWNKSKEKKVPYFSSWSFSQVSHKISSSLGIQVHTCYSVPSMCKKIWGETNELMVWII